MDEVSIAKQCRDTMYKNDVAIQALDISVEVMGAGAAEARLDVRAEMINGHDVCHGGYIFSVADTAFAYACNSHNKVTVASSASIEFLRPAKLGDQLVALAEVRRRGGRIGIYDVIVRNQKGEEVALFRGRSYSMREALIA